MSRFENVKPGSTPCFFNQKIDAKEPSTTTKASNLSITIDRSSSIPWIEQSPAFRWMHGICWIASEVRPLRTALDIVSMSSEFWELASSIVI
jgi:hypothetical protein